MHQSDSPYSITLDREDLGFSAAHFMTSDGILEELSGHSYQLKLEIIGGINSEGFITDFRILKPALKEVIKKYNHKTIVPTLSSHIVVRVLGDQIEIVCGSHRFSLPKSHCVLIEQVNASTEILSECLILDLLELIPAKDRHLWQRCRLTISESPGQSASFEVCINE